MTVLETLAAFVHGLDAGALTEADRDHLKLHVFDSLGAMLAGAHTDDGRALSRLASGKETDGEVLRGTAAARSTEMDDIHLASCTTPGSVVVPTALALEELSTPAAFLGAVAAGYEVLVRLGLAIEGPKVLGAGVWPTLFAAPLGAAAVASRAFELDTGATADALSTALALTTGTSIRPSGEPTSRWLTLGAAARNGVLAARGAAAGMKGARDLFETRGPKLSGVAISGETLGDGLGSRFRFREVGLKPYPVARQALSAVEACRELAGGFPKEDIEAIAVGVPAAQQRIIDHSGVPATRMASIVSVRYLAALALLEPARLHEVERSPPYTTDAIEKLASRVRVESAPELERHYPERWPARVVIRGKGKAASREVLTPAGDVESDFSWREDTEKLTRTLAPAMSRATLESLARGVRELEQGREWPFPELRAVLGGRS